jgi:hypothetical protein
MLAILTSIRINTSGSGGGVVSSGGVEVDGGVVAKGVVDGSNEVVETGVVDGKYRMEVGKGVADVSPH